MLCVQNNVELGPKLEELGFWVPKTHYKWVFVCVVSGGMVNCPVGCRIVPCTSLPLPLSAHCL